MDDSDKTKTSHVTTLVTRFTSFACQRNDVEMCWFIAIEFLRNFVQARDRVHAVSPWPEVAGPSDWREWVEARGLPEGVPSEPDRAYAGSW
eukprot:scaffold530569_cov29-Prasinocladus_malaysianus.AAC.1